MSREELLAKVNEVIRDVLDNEDLVITEETEALDVDGWDSLAHITIVATIEDEFDIKFAMDDVINMKNISQMIDKISELL